MSSECRGSASQVMPSVDPSTSLPGTRMLCTQSWYPWGPRIPRLVTSQFQEEPSDIDDVAEKNKVVSMYTHTELLLHMAVNARWCSTLHKSNRNNNLANREFPSYNSVSAAVHALEQTTNFAFTSNERPLQGVPRTLFSEQRCRSVLVARLSASRQQALSRQLAVPFRWEARQSLHKSTTFAETRGVAVKNDKSCLTLILFHDRLRQNGLVSSPLLMSIHLVPNTTSS